MTSQSSLDPPSRTRVFISHSHANREDARDISEALRAARFSVWLDAWELQAGDSIAAKVREGLSTSDFLVVLLSPESVRSRWVREEIAMALSKELRQRAITVVPVLLQDCNLPPALRDLLYVDLRGDRHEGIAKLVESLSRARAIDFARLTPRQFEEMVADVFRAEGYSVQLSASTRDGGRDLMLMRPHRARDSGELNYAVQVKHYRRGRVAVATIREFVGSLVLAGRRTGGLIVSSTQLTSAAQEAVADVNRRLGLRLEVIDGPALEKRVLQHPTVVSRYFERGDSK